MSWNPDPVEETCPMLDELMDAIKMNDWEHHRVTKNDLLQMIEQLRSANHELRSWGRKLYCQNQELIKENLQLQKDYERRI
jgi:hypothetical protein